MKKILHTILFLFCTSVILSQSGVTVIDSILSNGIYRKFRLYVPNIYNASNPVPLILNLHGYTSNAAQQQPYSNFMAVADTANFLVVHPDGTGQTNFQFWNSGFGGTVDDVMFMRDLIDSLSFIYSIDQLRVYSCGMSNGGIMSYYLACYLPNRIAAIASVTGSMLNAWLSCAPSRPFPVMEIHGTGDGTVPYNGDGTFAPIDSVIKKWRSHNNCNPSPVTYSVPDVNTTDNSTAVNYKYINGNAGTTVELYKVTGGSHSWPGALPIFSNTNEDFSATTEIWRFFRQYKLSMMMGSEEQRSADKIKLFPDPASSFLLVEGLESAEMTVFSPEGKKLISEKNVSALNVQGLEPGFYFVEVKKDGKSSLGKFIKD